MCAIQNGQPISYESIVRLYYDSRSNTDTPRLTLTPKLKYEHVHLTSFSKMRVDLAGIHYLPNNLTE